jgi:hypothetical protein
MGDVNKFFLDPISRQFVLPKTMENDPLAWQKDYDDALAFYSDRVLEFAAKKIITSRDSRSFPLVAECLKACKETHGEFSTPEPKNKGHLDEWAIERRQKADKLLNSVIGRRAADEGWHWELWDWLRLRERWPNMHEADALKAKTVARNAETAEFIANEERLGRLVPATRKLLGDMSKRRKQLRDIAYGKTEENVEYSSELR